MNASGRGLPEALQELWGHLYSFCRSAKNAQTQGQLAIRLGHGVRSIRKMTGQLADLGYPVASSCEEPYGVFIPVTRAEQERYKAQLKSRIVKLAKRLRAFGLALTDEEIEQLKMGEIPQQLEMFKNAN